MRSCREKTSLFFFLAPYNKYTDFEGNNTFCKVSQHFSKIHHTHRDEVMGKEKKSLKKKKKKGGYKKNSFDFLKISRSVKNGLKAVHRLEIGRTGTKLFAITPPPPPPPKRSVFSQRSSSSPPVQESIAIQGGEGSMCSIIDSLDSPFSPRPSREPRSCPWHKVASGKTSLVSHSVSLAVGHR